MRVCFFGAGNIAHAHAQALQSANNVILAGIFDINEAAAKRFAVQHKIPKVFTSMDEAIQDPDIDSIHVLTPPDSHFELVSRIAHAGKRVFVEKPVVTTAEQAETLLSLSSNLIDLVGVNQNSCFHPAFAKALQTVKSGNLGHVRYIECTFEPFLKQLAAGQFTHWMFSSPLNLLLEQAVHPIAQIVAIANSLETSKIVVMPGKSIAVTDSNSFVPSLTASFEQGGIPVTFRMRVGASYPVWQLRVICDDGYVIADMLTNNITTSTRSKFLEASDNAITQSRVAYEGLKQNVGNFKDYCLAQAGLKSRNDSFFLGMKGSILAFYKSISTKEPFIANARFGLALVDICTKIAKELPSAKQITNDSRVTSNGVQVTVFGATGFIGSHAVAHLSSKGYEVVAVARGTKNLGWPFHAPGVTLFKGDIKNRTEVASAINGSKFVINLAHGGGGNSYAEIESAMLGGALSVANACEAAGVERLIHVGSIASLYLGDPNTRITAETPADPQRKERGDYARAKAECDDQLQALAKKMQTTVINLRPGLVVGKGTSPLHSGIGFFNNEQHVIGWNNGDNPLPFVLVSDVVDAIEKSLYTVAKNYAAYNLVGDFRPSAKLYTAMLATDLGRPLKFNSSSVNGLMSVEIGKWMVKRVAGKKAAFPSKRDLLSRGLKAQFDCSDAKRDLNWHPVCDESSFREQATKVHVS